MIPKDPVKQVECIQKRIEIAKRPKNLEHLKNIGTRHGTYTCKICGIVFTVPGGLGSHMRNVHPKNPTETCKVCGKVMKSGALGGHMSVAHPKGGVPHAGAEKLKHVWDDLGKEDHVARADMMRASKFSHLDDITITEFQRQMILGSLLGDMVIWRQGKNTTKYGKSNPEIRVSHSTKQREYVMWKYEILKDIARKEPYDILQKTGFGAGLSACRFETKSLPCLNPIYDIVIGKSGKKRISQEWLDQIINPLALATWYMDDGSRGGKEKFSPWFALGLSTDEEVEIIRCWLVDKWGITTNYRRDPSYYNENTYAILQIARESRKEFVHIIEPFIIPSMRYKI
jgi:hypothetical protein